MVLKGLEPNHKSSLIQSNLIYSMSTHTVTVTGGRYTHIRQSAYIISYSIKNNFFMLEKNCRFHLTITITNVLENMAANVDMIARMGM